MDDLERYVEEHSVSRENVLKYVDQYSLFSFYIGTELETRTKYSSPLRQGDNDPSFSIYWSDKYEGMLFWKDSATGKSGDVFMFLREFMGNGVLTPNRKVLLQINRDFQLGLQGEDVGEFIPHLAKKIPIKKFPTKIQITAHIEPRKEFLDYWMILDIDQDTQKRYYAKDVRVIHYISDQHVSIVAKILTISYEILGHYKIYQPFAEKCFKFRNDYLDLYVEGALQLEFKEDFCVITKSTKDVMFLWQHFRWEAVAPKSENTPINEYFMNSVLRKKYKTVFIWLDPDEAGINSQQQYMEKYPWLIPIIFDDFIAQKDPTDLYVAAKENNKELIALNYMKNLIEQHL